MPEAGNTPAPDPDRPLAADFAAFWDFAGTLWADPEARTHLMRWQDVFDVDVMLALFALWYPHPLTGSQWNRLGQTARHWQAFATGRIRRLRRRLRTPERDALYHAVLALELQSERLAGMRLLAQARCLVPPDTPPRTGDRRRRLRTLFPDLPEDEIRDALHAFRAA